MTGIVQVKPGEFITFWFYSVNSV